MRKTTLLTFCLSALLLGPGSRTRSAPTSTAAALPALIAALADGPIQVRAGTLPPDAVPARAAVRAARRAIGLAFDVSQAQPVTLTDRENLSRPPRDLPCWLVPSVEKLRLLSESGTPGRETLFAVVDAGTGLFVEAFTRPRAPWWRRISPTNEALLVSLGSRSRFLGVAATPAGAPPRRSLATALHYVRADQRPGEFMAGRGDQLVARFLVYTDFNSSKGNKLQILRQPVWYVSSEGLGLPFMGSVPAPMPGHTEVIRLPRTEELNDIVNAMTGENYGTLEYRSGLQTDIMR